MLSLLLFCSYFFIRIRFIVRKYYGTVVLLIILLIALKALLAILLTLYDYWPISKFRDSGIKPLLRKNITLSFKDIEYKETYMRLPP
jgi:hypothetical protein